MLNIFITIISLHYFSNLIPQVNLKYYTIDEFNTCNIINQTMDSFFCISLQYRSLGANFDVLTSLLYCIQINIFGLTETKILQNKNTVIDTDLKLTG